LDSLSLDILQIKLISLIFTKYFRIYQF